MHHIEVEYRQALSNFVTGITIISSIDEKNKPFAITINSFSSISLEPKILSWALGLHNKYLSSIQNNPFIIQILDADSAHIAKHFSKTANSQDFSIAEFHYHSNFNMPILNNCLAYFICRKFINQTVGDHELFLSQVLHYSINTQNSTNSALTFFRSNIKSSYYY